MINYGKQKNFIHYCKSLKLFLIIFFQIFIEVSGKPISKGSIQLSIEICCKIVENNNTYRWEKRATLSTMSVPGQGPLTELYDTPFYHQVIKRQLCTKNLSDDLNPYCENAICKQNYVKQKILAQEFTSTDRHTTVLQYIWVPYGCKFKLLTKNVMKNSEYKIVNKSWSGDGGKTMPRPDFNSIEEIIFGIFSSKQSNGVLKCDSGQLIIFTSLMYLLQIW